MVTFLKNFSAKNSWIKNNPEKWQNLSKRLEEVFFLLDKTEI